MKPLQDARGQPVNLASLRPGPGPVSADPRHAKLRRMRVAMGLVRRRGCAVPGVGCLFGVLFLAAIVAVFRYCPADLALMLTLPLWVGMIFLMIIALETIPRRRDKDWLNTRVARLGLCAGCGYDLAGLTPDDDACTTCPECGAAWRLGQPIKPDASA